MPEDWRRYFWRKWWDCTGYKRRLYPIEDHSSPWSFGTGCANGLAWIDDCLQHSILTPMGRPRGWMRAWNSTSGYPRAINRTIGYSGYRLRSSRQIMERQKPQNVPRSLWLQEWIPGWPSKKRWRPQEIPEQLMRTKYRWRRIRFTNTSRWKCDRARISWRKEAIGSDFRQLKYWRELRYG